MRPTHGQNLDAARPCLSDALLGLYDCYLDPAKITYLIDLLGSWLGDDQGQSAIPQFESHSEKIWLMLTRRMDADPAHGEAKHLPDGCFYIGATMTPLDGPYA